MEPLQPSLPMKPGQQWTVGKDMEPPTADATSLTGSEISHKLLPSDSTS